MKKFFFVIVVFLYACSPTSNTNLELSSAKISNVRIESLGKHTLGYYKLDIQFDYEITKFHDIPNLYRCSVQFAKIDGSTSSSSAAGERCIIRHAAGRKNIFISTPIDKEFMSSVSTKEKASSYKRPLQYLILILQWVQGNPDYYKGIAMTKIYTLDETVRVPDDKKDAVDAALR